MDSKHASDETTLYARAHIHIYKFPRKLTVRENDDDASLRQKCIFTYTHARINKLRAICTAVKPLISNIYWS